MNNDNVKEDSTLEVKLPVVITDESDIMEEIEIMPSSPHEPVFSTLNSMVTPNIPENLNMGIGIQSGNDSEIEDNELRRQIKKIRDDKTISAQEKAAQIQQLMMGKYSQLSTSNISIYSGNSSQSSLVYNSSSPLPSSLESTHTLNESITCTHYERACRVIAKCCERVYPCRFCHDNDNTHRLDSSEIHACVCAICGTVQPISNLCVNEDCKTKFGEYFCELCRLWSNENNENIYHCTKCNLCRIGPPEYFYHCDTCNCCIIKEIRSSHKCIERNLECDCPICGEYLFTSKKEILFMLCGHPIHCQCYTSHIQNSYQCPTCLKSITPMESYFKRIDELVSGNVMPEEYSNMVSVILCNDCLKKSVVSYHFVYHKCKYCNSYNTNIITTKRLSDEIPMSPNTQTNQTLE